MSTGFAGQPAVAQQREVSGSFFSTLGVKPAMGRLLVESDDSAGATAAAVVSHRFWKNVLGSDQQVIGQTISVNTDPHVIVGVLEPSYYGLLPGDTTEIYTSLYHSQSREQLIHDARSWTVSLIARRSPGVSATQIQPVMQAAFSSTWSRQLQDPSKAPRIRLDNGARGLGFLRSEFRNPLFVLGGLVGLLLVIACANIANLLLARATARQKEVALRVSLGCCRSRLMRQFLTESALLAVLGGAASVIVAYLTAAVLGEFLGGRRGLPIDVAPDIRLFTIASVLTVAALLLFGLFPAWRGSRQQSAAWLKEGAGSLGSAAQRKWNTGRVLILAQMAMSVVLVLSAVLFTRNLVSIQSADTGFDRRNLVLFGLRPGTSGYGESQLPGFYFGLEQRLAEAPGVAAVGLASYRPMNIGGWWQHVRLKDGSEAHSASMNGVTPSYLPLYTAGMVAGRNLSWADITGGAQVAVISEDLARALGGPGVLGRRLTVDRPPGLTPPEFEIVGIAPVIAATSMKERPYAVWLPLKKANPEVTVVLRTSQPPQTVLPAIREAMAGIDPNLPMVNTITMEEQIARGLQRERMFATLCVGFGILALVLTAVGLYGVIAYNTSRRQGEIGVRLALGAVPGDVLAMVLREGLGLAALGMLVGIPAVWMGAKYVEQELFQMRPLEPVSLLMALGILLAAALVAVGIPAYRASKLQPVQALRQE